MRNGTVFSSAGSVTLAAIHPRIACPVSGPKNKVIFPSRYVEMSINRYLEGNAT